MNDSSHKAESLGQTGLLLSSASEGNVTRINELLEGGVSMDSCDYDRRTALHLAATEGHSHVVELMLKRGANINPVDRWGDTVNSSPLRSLDVSFQLSVFTPRLCNC